MKLLVLDNYDSFTYNLVQLIEKTSDIEYEVCKNDKITLEKVNEFDKILLSPGPGIPVNAGIMNDLIRMYASKKSILGVCLGLQAIGEVFGARLINLDTVYHGVASEIELIAEDPLFDHCPKKFTAGRYHSWALDYQSITGDLLVTALDAEKCVMALRHKHYDVKGVQFHPES
ncbi:MAG: aminodeoxychorismate/anthranilate synthase component II, partial [Bacteroidota bacterium]